MNNGDGKPTISATFSEVTLIIIIIVKIQCHKLQTRTTESGLYISIFLNLACPRLNVRASAGETQRQ